MPIKDIDNRITPGSKFPRWGNIFKGAPKPNAKQPGKDLDYFRFELAERWAYRQPLLTHIIGDKPDVLRDVFLLGRTLDDVFQYWNEQWSTVNGDPFCVIRCDGENQIRHYDGKEAGLSKEPIPCIAPDCKCQMRGRLKVAIPAFGLGYFLLKTGSQTDIDNIVTMLTDCQNMNDGTLVGLYFNIFRYTEKRTYEDDKGKTREREVSFIGIEPVGATGELLIARQQQAALPAGEWSEDDIDLDTGEIIDSEADISDGTAYLFDNPAEQSATFGVMALLNLPLQDWTAEQRIAAVLVMKAIHGSDADERPDWLSNKTAVDNFLLACKNRYGMNTVQIVDALDMLCDYEVLSLDDFQGSLSAAGALVSAASIECDEHQALALEVSDTARAGLLTAIRYFWQREGQEDHSKDEGDLANVPF